MARPKTGVTPLWNFRAPRPLWEAAKVAADAHGETVTDVLVRALERYVREYEREQRKAPTCAATGSSAR